jgi:hypothetical protein
MAAGYVCALWRATGGVGWLQGAIPGAAANPDDTLAGGILLPAFSGTTGRVYRFAPVGTLAGVYYLYDRIGHMGGLSGTNTGVQAVNLAIATPLASGRCLATMTDVGWYLEIYTDIGTTAANITVTYTDSADVGSKTIVISGFSGASPLNRVGRCVRLNPSDGVAIKSVQSVQLSGTTGTAGSFGVTARVLKCSVGQSIANAMGVGVDAISIGLPEIKDSVCLELLQTCTTTSTGILLGDLVWGQVAE